MISSIGAAWPAMVARADEKDRSSWCRVVVARDQFLEPSGRSWEAVGKLVSESNGDRGAEDKQV